MRVMFASLAALLCAPALADPPGYELMKKRMIAEWPGYTLLEVEALGAAWEVEIRTADGREIEALFSTDGELLHFHDEADEQEISVEDLPAAVEAAVAAGWPGAKRLEAERAGSVYEVEIRSAAGERVEIVLQADGTVLASGVEREEEEEEEED